MVSPAYTSIRRRLQGRRHGFLSGDESSAVWPICPQNTLYILKTWTTSFSDVGTSLPNLFTAEDDFVLFHLPVRRFRRPWPPATRTLHPYGQSQVAQANRRCLCLCTCAYAHPILYLRNDRLCSYLVCGLGLVRYEFSTSEVRAALRVRTCTSPFSLFALARSVPATAFWVLVCKDKQFLNCCISNVAS